MKTLLLILTIYFMAITDLIAQVNPLGVYVDIDGMVKFWRSEANRNGNVDDTVYISVNGKTHLDDLRNLKYDYLTLVEAPRSNWTIPSNLDPSRINDTTLYGTTSSSGISFISTTIPVTLSTETIIVSETTNQNFYCDDVRGDGLNDSVINLVKIKLNNLIDRYYGKALPDEQMNQLRKEISYHDTVIEKTAVYDYIVDMIVAHEYDGNGQLTKVLGYHWNLGIEVDHLKYDKSGKLIYFSRENLGTNRSEYSFKYDKFGRVTTLTENHHSLDNENSLNTSSNKTIRFTYDSVGIMRSKAELQEGNWLTYYFEIK